MTARCGTCWLSDKRKLAHFPNVAAPTHPHFRCKEEHVYACMALILLAILGGCTDTGDAVPLNDQAHQLGTFKISFVRTGVGRGPVTIIMPDGEELTGEYRVAFNSALGTAFSGTQTASAIVVSDSPQQFVATGPRTQILCWGG